MRATRQLEMSVRMTKQAARWLNRMMALPSFSADMRGLAQGKTPGWLGNLNAQQAQRTADWSRYSDRYSGLIQKNQNQMRQQLSQGQPNPDPMRGLHRNIERSQEVNGFGSASLGGNLQPTNQVATLRNLFGRNINTPLMERGAELQGYVNAGGGRADLAGVFRNQYNNRPLSHIQMDPAMSTSKGLFSRLSKNPYQNRGVNYHQYEVGGRVRPISSLPNDPYSFAYKGGGNATNVDGTPLFYSGVPTVSGGYAVNSNNILSQYQRPALSGFYTPHFAVANPAERISKWKTTPLAKPYGSPGRDGNFATASKNAPTWGKDRHYEMVSKSPAAPVRQWKVNLAENGGVEGATVQPLRRVPDAFYSGSTAAEKSNWWGGMQKNYPSYFQGPPLRGVKDTDMKFLPRTPATSKMPTLKLS